MKRIALVTTMAVALAASAPAALALSISPGTVPGVATGSPPDPNDIKQLPERDKTFMERAAQSNMEEIMLGMMAKEKGASEMVRAHGEKMVKDHLMAAQRQVRLAHQLGVALPATLTPEQMAAAEQLGALEGEAFDRAYLARMVEAHDMAVQLFRDEAGHGFDPDVRHFAASTLPVLQKHLEKSVKMSRGEKPGRGRRH